MTALRLGSAGAAAGACGAAFVLAPGLVAVAVPAAFFLGAGIVLGRCCTTSVADDGLRRRLDRWIVYSYIAHLGIGMLITYVPTLGTYFGGDSFQYDSGARQLVDQWLNDGPAPLFGSSAEGKTGFTYVLAGMYAVLGPYAAIGVALNAFFAASLVPLMLDATHKLVGRDAASWVPPLVVLPPAFLLWPSQLLREAGVLFFMAVALNAAVRMRHGLRPGSLVAISLAVGCLFMFRHYVALTVAGGMVLGLTFAGRGVRGVSASVGTAVLIVGLVFGAGLGYGGLQTLRSTDLDRASVIRRGSATEAASGFLVDADVSTTENALLYLPRSIPRMLIGPFPWEVRGLRQLPAILDAAVIWALVPSLRRGWRAARSARDRILVFLLPSAGFLTIVLSLLVANYGTVVRARSQILLLAVPLLALGFSHRNRAEEPTDRVRTLASTSTA